MGDLFEEYPTGASWDEMLRDGRTPRTAYLALHEALSGLSAPGLEERCEVRDRFLRDQGVTFSLSGEERPFPLDLVPRILSAAEWRVIEGGVAQRVRALEAFLADVYGLGEILKDEIVPRRVVTSASHFHRPASGIVPPNGVRVHVSGVDLVRGADGAFRVLEDNLRTPSGVSYVIENRRTMARVFPELFARHRVRPVDAYPPRLLEALRAAAPAGVADPTVVVLTPGVFNSAYFEHSFLARQMGVELVEGRDLFCRDGFVYMRSTSGDQRVDVVYRRVDDDFLDPLHFRANSLLGCPGILNSARAGQVAIANAVGNGVADDKLVYTYVPAMIDYYLGEKPLLANVETLRLEEPDQLRSALDRLDELVLKPVDASGGYGLLIGPQANDEQLTAARAAIVADPRAWIAQEVVRLSTSPTLVDGRLRPRHVDLRPFAINDGERIWVAPGGLTRVALPEGSLVVNSSQGGGSKDTWVLAGGTGPELDEHDVEQGAGGATSDLSMLELVDPPAGPGLQAGPQLARSQQQQQQQQQPRDRSAREGRRC
ncbi:MAG: circularly permuted type 2 ATP-grasp protein [Acidimicrobiia bacterium]